LAEALRATTRLAMLLSSAAVNLAAMVVRPRLSAVALPLSAWKNLRQ
jgi:hypothetical protein